MPYLSVTIGKKLEEPQREKLKAELCRLIAIIPGKSEADLMVEIRDTGSSPQEGAALYMSGSKEPSAYIDLRMYTATTEEAKKRFTRETFALITREFAIPSERQYLTIGEYSNWGYEGEWH
jgi:hypothetical protein